MFSGTAIFLSFSHTHKFNLHFLRRHVAQIEYSKKVWKNDFSAASWHSHLRRYFAVSFCRGTMGWRGSAAGAVVEGKKERKGLKEKPWLTFNRLISFGFIRLSPQTGPVAAALSLGCRWTCTQPAGLAGA